MRWLEVGRVILNAPLAAVAHVLKRRVRDNAPYLLALTLIFTSLARADDGYRLWLRYDRIGDESLRRDYLARTQTIFLAAPAPSPTLDAAREELTTGFSGLLGATPKIEYIKAEALAALGDEGFSLRATDRGVEIVGARNLGVLYGAFALLRHLQTHQPLAHLDLTSAPRIQRRMLNHWDNLNGTIERGYAGRSLWQWSELPGKIDPRYRDYARANASIGINAAVLTNVNASAQVLTADYLRKVAALAGVFRPYGIKVISPRVSARRSKSENSKPPTRSIATSSPGGRTKPRRSIARSPTSVVSW